MQNISKTDKQSSTTDQNAWWVVSSSNHLEPNAVANAMDLTF
jgi:hypothetical protein